MKNIFKSVLSLTVAMGLTIGNTPFIWGISEQDTYVALGDSISTGRALEDIENNLFVNKIKKEYNLNLDNKAVDGMDTTAMLDLLNSNDEKGIEYKNAIKDAELITISMGGNNLLQPLMEMMKKGLGLDSNATGIELQEAMKKNPNALSILATSLQNLQVTQSLSEKVKLFAEEFPEIIKVIKELNPNAEIIIQTVYNPLHDVKDLSALANGVDVFFQGMNKAINEYSVLGYELVDIYEEFKSNDSQVPLTNMSKFDVHPNKDGNEVIFAAHKEILDKEILDKEENEIEVKSLAGNDRYETAIKVSQERFDEGEADAVILVGKEAVVDGLAAAPFAVRKNAPILFADVNSLNDKTKQEMLRVLGTDYSKKTVYIIGGETRISTEVELMLGELSEYGVKVDRIHGGNRYETSLNVAKQLNSNSKVAFVVGGDGEVDAMSISAKAAELKAPIVVVEKDKLSEEAKDLLTNKEIYIIGGDSCVSEDVKLELDKLDIDKNAERVAGLDRKETNAKVINKFYNAEDVSELFVAKDGYVGGKDKLVDALATSPLAATKFAPILLTTEGLNQLQEESIKGLNNVKSLTRVGNGISKNTINTVVDLLNQ